MFNNIDLNKGKIDGINLKDSVYLTKEEYTEMSQQVIEVAQQELTLIDNAFPTVTASPTKKKYNYVNLSDTGKALILKRPADAPSMSVNGSDVDVDITWKAVSFELEREDIANSRKLGEKLDTLHARISARMVKTLQDEALYNKSSAFGTLGVYAQATGSFSGSDWTTTTTNIYDQIRQIIASVPIAYRNPNATLILHGDQLSELYRDSWDNGTAIIQVTAGSFAAKVKEAWPQLKIIASQWVTAGEAIFFPNNEQVVRRVVGVTPRVIDWKEDKLSIQMITLARDVLVVPTPSAVIKVTGI